MNAYSLMRKLFQALDKLRERLMGRMDWLEEKYRAQETRLRELEQTAILSKIQLKSLRGEKIKVVFVCHRPALWSSLATVWQAFLEDPDFEVAIVAIPNKKQIPKLGLLHEVYDDEGAWDFFKNFPGQVIKGYEETDGFWVDLKSLSPDLVFFQTPYDICRPPAYRSSAVAGYAFLGYVDYGLSLVSADIARHSFPADFAANLTLCFAESEERKNFMDQVLNKARDPRCRQTVVSGYPRLDGLDGVSGAESPAWLHPRTEGRFRIIWTPRWCVKEGTCFFFDLKDKLLDYARKHENEVELLFRPHPQAFLEYQAAGLMTPEEIEALEEEYRLTPNASIDRQAEYLSSFHSSDLLISDFSSIMGEYLLTGRPIIYCHRTDTFSPFGRRLAEGFYWVHDWAGLEKAIDQLRRADDPLAAKRQELAAQEFYRPEEGAGQKIKNMCRRLLKGDS